MKLVQKILNKINGLHYNQEYLCLDKETFQQPLHVYLLDGRRVIKDITNLHCFVGYCPLIFGLPGSIFNTPSPQLISIALSQKSFTQNEILPERDAIACLSMEKINELTAGNETFHFFEGRLGRHRFVSNFSQQIIQLNNQLFNKKPGNVFLEGNMYKQVQIAYAIPRKISLVTVRMDNRYNLFPTDLHGSINDYYLISLRHQGKACQQVLESGKILLSQVNCEFYKRVYGLGKNHMQSLKERELFPFTQNESEKLRLPIPEQASFYRELEVQDSFIHGIHRILLFKVLNDQSLTHQPKTLAHIHNTYGTWRHKKGLPGNFLMR